MPPPNAIGGLYNNASGTTPGGCALVKAWTWEVDTRSLDPQEEDLFRRYLLSEAMIVLGNIRSKEDSIASVGGDRTFNGESLKAEGVEIREQLKQDVLNWKRPVPLITG